MLNIDTSRQLQIALQHHEAGRLREAEAIYRQLLSQDPNHADALHLLGLIALAAGHHPTALDLIGRAIALNPNSSQYFNNLGEVWRRADQPQKALEAYAKAISLAPQYAAPYGNMGLVLHAQGKADEAAAAFGTALQLEPQSAVAHCNLGDALAKAGKTDEAIRAYRNSIALQPRHANAHNNLGALFVSLGRLQEAEACFRTAQAAAPADAAVVQNLADLLVRTQRTTEAMALFRRAIELDPRRAEPYAGLGNTLKNSNQPDEAIAAYRKAIELKPDFALAYANMGGTLRDRGQLDEAIAALRKAVELDPALAAAHSSLILTLYLQAGVERGTIEAEQRLWDERYAKPRAAAIVPHDNDPSPERRLRIAYLSPDLREHPVGRFMLPLLANHNHEQFEIVCYSTATVADAFSQRLRQHADLWREVAALEEEALANLIRADRVDILVDLAMHTVENRLLILARKPAPIQISYLATCHGNGLSTMDYRLSDPYLDPPDTAAEPQAQSYERPLRLAETYWCYAPAIETPPVNPLPAAVAGYITFGSLNHFCKINTAAMATWGCLLQRVPSAKLILHVPAGSPQERVRQEFLRGGIDLQRLQLVARVSTPEYFALYHKIDIGLDPFPYVGGTTTCDTLWMGVPVVSMAGQIPTSRGGLSILSNMGMAELVAQSPEQYVEIAAALAGDLPRLLALRANLRPRMQQSPLMDAPRFTRNVELAFRTAWRRWCMENPA